MGGWGQKLRKVREQKLLFTTDPAQARYFATMLLVGESLDECEGYLREAGLGLTR